MTKEQLKQLLADKKISQEVYDEMCRLIDAGKQVSQKEIDEVVAKLSQLEDEKKQLEKKTIEDDFNKGFANFKKELCDEEIIGKSLSEAELKEIYTRNSKDLKQAVVEAINLWATKEAKSAGILDKGAKAFQQNDKIGKKVLELQAKVLNALGIQTLRLDNLPTPRILVDILMNDKTYEIYSNKMNELMNSFHWVEVGEGINRVKQLELGLEVDDGSLIPTAEQVAATKAANFSFNVEFKLTDTKYKSYVSITDGDYVKYFKSSADLVGFIQNTIGKIKRAIYLYQYSLIHTAYNDVFKLLYAKATDGTTNHILCEKENMLDALGEFKEAKEEVKQFQSTKYTIEDSNMTYAPSTSEFVYVAPLKAKTNIEKFNATALTGDANSAMVGNIIYIPDTYYNPLTKQIVKLNVFTDGDGVVHNNCILAIEKAAFVGMYNLDVDTSADYPFGLTRVMLSFFRGNIELDKTCKCFLFEADALLQDFTIPTTEQSEETLVAPLTEKVSRKGRKGK